MWSVLRGSGSRSVHTKPGSMSSLSAANRLREEANRYEDQGNLEKAKECFEAGIREVEDGLERTRGETELRKTKDQLAASYFYYATLLRKYDKSGAADHYKRAMEYARGMDVRQPEARMLFQQISARYGSLLIKDESVSPSSPSLMLSPCQVDASVQEKSKQADYLFEKALSTLSSLEVSNKPSLFLVYAHDNSAHGQAQASIAKYLIEKLSQIRVNLYSDQTPMGQPYLSALNDLNLKEDGKLEDILTSQLCLLPDQLRDDVKPVDKVAVCCSEVLSSYLKWAHYENFYQALQQAYLEDREAYRKGGKQQGRSAIREVVREFSQDPKYKGSFHHVLTEMAFLQIRAAQLQDRHGVIPVPLMPNSYQQCLAHFIPETTVRMGDIYRLERQAQAGREVYPNQSRHAVLFKLIERLLVGNDEAKTFLDKFWQGYNDCIARLNNESSPLGWSAFSELVDGIFDGIQKELYKDQARNLSEHIKIVRSLRPANFSSMDLRKALYQYYQRSNLSIQRVSGQTVSLDDCYINLAIVESRAQREKDKEELEQRRTAFERLPSSEKLAATNPNKLIPLEQLFENQTLRDGSENVPKRILIQGRAGIGKTTLCKKLVYEYHHNKRWQDRFDYVLWIPLRQLKTHSPTRLKDLLCNQYFAGCEKSQAQALSDVLHEHQDRTLFILDGLDEVTEMFDSRHALHHFLKSLLDQTHVLITSRPAGVNASQCNQLDLELETIGFSAEDVTTYIDKFAPESNQAAIQQFIDRTPLIQGLVNIPIQLDALCYSWDKLQQNQEVTMSMLYEAMVDKLWRKDSVRLEKKEDGQLLGADVIDSLPEADLEELMKAEIDYLGYLAFKGLEAEKIEFSREELGQRRKELNEQSQVAKKLPIGFTTNLKKTSYLHTADAERPEAERRYHFLHLTFQEFFAAKFLVNHLQACTNVEKAPAHIYGVQKNLNVRPTQYEVEAFIATHKYDPRYEIVWWMVAGLLKENALEYFFELLQKSPSDLIGGYHQRMLMGCLNEARSQLMEKTIAKLEAQLTQWLYFEIKSTNSSDYYFTSGLGRRGNFPEHLLLSSLSQLKEHEIKIIKTLGARQSLSVSANEALVKNLDWESGSFINYYILNALDSRKVLSQLALHRLVDIALYDRDWEIKNAASHLLKTQKSMPYSIIWTLIGELTDETVSHGEYRMMAGDVLFHRKMLPETAIQELIQALQHKDRGVRDTAATVLSRQEMLSRAAVQALVQVLQDKKGSDRFAVAKALSGEKILSDSAVQQVFVQVLQDEESSVRTLAVRALGGETTLPKLIIQALIQILGDKDSSVRSAVFSLLGKQKMLSEPAVQALIQSLQDKDSSVRAAAVGALSTQKALPEPAVQALIQSFQDKDSSVRAAAVGALSTQKALPEPAVQALIQSFQDKDSSVRAAAVGALSTQKALPEPAVQALIQSLQDKDRSVRAAAVDALSTQKTLSESAVQTLVHVLQDKDSSVRPIVASVLAGQKTLPEFAAQALIQTLQNEDIYVGIAAVNALHTQKILPELAFQVLIQALQHKDSSVRKIATSVLGSQESLSESVVQSLIKVLQDENSDARSTAVEALGHYISLPNVLLALSDSLEDKNSDVRSAAARVLGSQNSLPESLLLALIKILNDKNENVRSEVARALGSHISQIFTLLPRLEPNQVQMLYTKILFSRSCKQIMSLFIQDNQLHFYTATGPGQPVHLTSKQRQMLTEAFKNVQTEGGILLSDEKVILIEE